MGGNGLYLALLGFTGLYGVVLGCSGLYLGVRAGGLTRGSIRGPRGPNKTWGCLNCSWGCLKVLKNLGVV